MLKKLATKTIRARLRRLAERMDATRKAYAHLVGEYNTNRREIQRRCPHTKTTFYGDPSGGNDSFVECDGCGAQAHRAEGLPK